MSRAEYLQRPLIEGVVYEITLDKVQIHNDRDFTVVECQGLYSDRN